MRLPFESQVSALPFAGRSGPTVRGQKGCATAPACFRPGGACDRWECSRSRSRSRWIRAWRPRERSCCPRRWPRDVPLRSAAAARHRRGGRSAPRLPDPSASLPSRGRVGCSSSARRAARRAAKSPCGTSSVPLHRRTSGRESTPRGLPAAARAAIAELGAAAGAPARARPSVRSSSSNCCITVSPDG